MWLRNCVEERGRLRGQVVSAGGSRSDQRKEEEPTLGAEGGLLEGRTRGIGVPGPEGEGVQRRCAPAPGVVETQSRGSLKEPSKVDFSCHP